MPLSFGPLAAPLGRDLRDAALRTAAGVVFAAPDAESGRVTEADLAGLPAPAQRYLRAMGVVGRPRDWSFLVRMSGRFRRRGQGWMPCDAWQYNANHPITRAFHMRIDAAHVVPMVGRDTYLDGHGAMHGKVFGVIPVVDGSGPEFDLGELVTYLNDALVLAPSMLLGEAVVWEAVDDQSFAVALTDRGKTVRAQVLVGADGLMQDLSTDDRWYDGPDGLVQARWRTPFQSWTDLDGRPWLTSAQAVWDLPDGPLPYIEASFVAGSMMRNVVPGALLGAAAPRASRPRLRSSGTPGAADDGPIERASANDMMQLATEAGSVPMQVGAVLVLEAGVGPDEARHTLARRVPAIPRLRQRLVWPRPGGGRPIWVDDGTFDLDDHVHVMRCPEPGDEAALLACATDILGTRLVPGRPLWAATIVTGLAGGRWALVIVFNHVLADGIGGLAALVGLVDGAPEPADYGYPRPPPTDRELVRSATRQRLHALAGWRRGLARMRSAALELRPDLRSSAPRTSLNQPTGSRRATRVVRADLDAVRATAHAHGATVNDVVLAAVTGALRGLLQGRGEDTDRVVVSIPISGRRDTTADRLGNEVGVLPVELPTVGAATWRLEAIARLTRSRKDAGAAPGSSAAIVDPMMRVLGRLGLLRGFIDHQHLINTLVTNLHGPDEPLSFAGAPISDLWPISVVTGNVTVAFAVLSYAGALTIVINSDADACPDLDVLARHLDQELATLTAEPALTA